MHVILFGDFGLLTLTPRYLFLVLFSYYGILRSFLDKYYLKFHFTKNESSDQSVFYGFIGLGCTTVALASLDYVKSPPMRTRMIWLLILVIPCSSQLAIIATFAAMVTLRVFLVYLFFVLLLWPPSIFSFPGYIR